MRIYGTIGICENCKELKKLHCKVKGLLHCQKCYSRIWMQDASNKRRHALACQRYVARHLEEIRRKNREYYARKYKRVENPR